MSVINWRNKRFLNDGELLEAAENACYELENLPLDNDMVTEEEDSDDDEKTAYQIPHNDYNPDLFTSDPVPGPSSAPSNDENGEEVGQNEQNKEKSKDDSDEDVTRSDKRKVPKNSNKSKKDQKCKVSNKDQRSKTRLIDRKWRKRSHDTAIPDYTLPEGPVEAHFHECITYTDYFLTMLGPATIDDIVYQTNLYATQRNKNLNLKKEELLAFFGINFFMGYHSLPSYKNYWSADEDFDTSIVRRTMSRNRFEMMLSNLHLNDNTTIPRDNKDKIYKIRPFVINMKTQFDLLHHGTRELAVDESIILFKGRSSLKQYNPKKPIKRGYKLWCIADQHGYIKDFDVYQGKDEVAEEKFGNYGLGERVVLSLTEKYWNQNRKIYFDNYFTTVGLLERLKAENTLACGTIRGNRVGLPTGIQDDKNMSRGQFDYRVSSLDISYFKWYDNKPVHLLSNFHGSKATEVSRLKKDGKRENIASPEIIPDYNHYMGGVDQADRLRQAYCVDRRSKKWWHRLFFGILDIAFVNSYVVYKCLNKEERISLLDFRRGVAKGLMIRGLTKARLTPKRASSNSPRSSPRSTPVRSLPKRRKYNYSVANDVRLGNLGSHWPIFEKERKRCEQCSSMGVESRPHSKCSSCNVTLCVNEKKNCFSQYHGIIE
jgi:hypothetical protein